MIVAIKQSQHSEYEDVLSQMFQTRKKVFCDSLHWDIPHQDDAERDAYDDMAPVYLVWCDRHRSRHYASVRLMPTTGPTLLRDVFSATFDGVQGVLGPGIWEGTRMCVDEAPLQRDFPDLAKGRAFSLLLTALCEFGLAEGIQTLVSNYEPPFGRIYARAGLRLHEVGRAHGFGRWPVCCGVFTVSNSVLMSMRATLGINRAVYSGEQPAAPLALLCAA